MPTLADQVDNGPMLFPSLQLLHRQVRQLGPAKPTAETERQDGSTALAPQGLDVGAVQQGSGLLGSEPVAQSDTQPLGPTLEGCQYRKAHFFACFHLSEMRTPGPHG